MKRLWLLIQNGGGVHPAPRTRTYIGSTDWVEILVAVGKDETATITLTKEAYTLLRQIFDSEEI
jgi:hypothetical protein